MPLYPTLDGGKKIHVLPPKKKQHSFGLLVVNLPVSFQSCSCMVYHTSLMIFAIRKSPLLLTQKGMMFNWVIIDAENDIIYLILSSIIGDEN